MTVEPIILFDVGIPFTAFCSAKIWLGAYFRLNLKSDGINLSRSYVRVGFFVANLTHRIGGRVGRLVS